MFNLHETTRKRICRTAFFALCVAPTIAVAAWVVARCLPSYADAQEAGLGAGLHARAELRGFRQPRPGVTECDELKLFDEASLQSLLELHHPRLHSQRGALQLTASSVIVDGANFDGLAMSVGAWLARHAGKAIDISLDRVTVRLPGGWPGCDLTDLQVRCEGDPSGTTRLRLAAQVSGSTPDKLQTLRIAVELNPIAATTPRIANWEIAAAPVPAGVLAVIVPSIAGLGPGVTFSGELKGTIDAGEVVGAGSGRLENVPLASFVPAGSPHGVNGVATVALSELRWRGEAVQFVAGALGSDNAVVTRSMIDGAAKHLYCVQADQIAALAGGPPTEMVALDRLACRFTIDATGLTLTGDMPAGAGVPDGCLATHDGRPLLMQPPYVDIPLGAWMQLVASPGTSWMPATADAVKAAANLPLP